MVNPHRDEIAGYLLRAECHYGHTLNEVEAGLTVAESVARRRVVVPPHMRPPGSEQVADCREAVHRVLNGEAATSRKQAGYDEAVCRSLLHFRDEMSPELHGYLVTRLGELQSTYKITPSLKPLTCYYPPWEPTLAVPVEDGGDLEEPEPDISTDEVDELGYASTEELQQVDDLAMSLALAEAARRWPEATVERMPHNNPGYDIEVRHQGGDIRYVEVKGTRADEPCFFITAGELAHSHRHPDRYSIWIFHDMDLNAGTATLTPHDGPVTEEHFELEPVQYVGRFIGSG